ncbi:MAG: glycosyltransferase [Anaerorhabdus sp.]
MRIGLFTDTYLPEINGVVSSVHTLRQVLENEGHTVFVITTNATNCKADDNVLRLSGVELKKLYGYVMTSPVHIKAYNKIKEMNLDIIHAHTEFGVGIFARIVSKMQNIPIVSTYHVTYEDYTHYVNVLNLNIVDKIAKKAVSRLSKLYVDSGVEIIVPSYKTKEMLERYNVKKSINVIPTGLNTEKFYPSEELKKKGMKVRKELDVADDVCLIVYLGRLAQEKSIDLLIKGMKEVKQEGVNCKLMVVGSGPEEDKLRDLADKLDVSDIVIFVGKKMSDEVPIYYAAADCFATASTSETQGMTYIEALASGLHVFAYPDNVLEELIEEGKTGYYFSDEIEFKNKIIEFISKNDKEKNIELILKKVEPYNIKRFYNSIIEVYNSAITKSRKQYQISKIRLKNDYVEILFLTSENSVKKVLVDVDVYFENGYRKGRLLDFKEVNDLLKMEETIKAYQKCIRKLSVKDRSRKEMYDWLSYNTDLQIGEINKIIEKLEAQGLISDYRFAKELLISMRSKLSGEKKIYNTLRKKGIDPDLIAYILEDERDTDAEYNNALKWGNKTLNTIKNKSLRMRKQSLKQKLYKQGYDSNIIEKVMKDINFVNDDLEEMDILRRLAGKSKKKYEKKFSGYKLRNMVFRYCAVQGFDTEDIYAILDEMEWNDEKN